MKKYWQIFRASMQTMLVYRLNFVMWRVRTIIGFLGIYWFWSAVYSQYDFIGSYSKNSMLLYLLVANFLRSLVLSNSSYHVCVEIASGDLNNYLIKPLNYFYNWLARDWADKLLNLAFFSVEVVILVALLKLPVEWPSTWQQGGLFLASGILAAVLYFFFSFVVSSFSFWYPEHEGWPLRFFMLMLLDFLSGQAFPLDIFPQALVQIFKTLPFYYFIFLPAQIYLNQLSGNDIARGMMIMVAWLLVLVYLTKIIWKKGLQIYGAFGR
jgi:ABC-2 type transport system permease protein